MSSKLVFIKSIPRQTATGASEWSSDTSGKKLHKTKIGRAVDKIMALYSPRVGGLANYISYNYHVDPATGQPFLNEKGQPILLQEHLENKWNKPPGFFSNQAASRNYKGDGSDLGYYYQKSWTLADGTTVLDLNLMDDEIGYYVMLASSLVANSEQEWRAHKWPKAKFYIALENESAELRFSKNQLKAKCLGTLEMMEFSDKAKRTVATLLGLVNAKSEVSSFAVYNLLVDYIESNTAQNLEKYLSLYNLTKTVDGKNKLEAMWTLALAKDLGVVYAKQDVWTWVTSQGQNLVIGDRYADAVDYLLSPKKEQELEEILAQIKEKQK
jgi:hypothetical protein